MNQKNSKVANIISLRSKILELRNQLEDLQRSQTRYSPIRSINRLSTENLNYCRSISKDNLQNNNPESYLRIHQRSKSKKHLPQRYSTYFTQNKEKNNKHKDKIKNNVSKLDLNKILNESRQIPNWRYQTMFLPKNQSRSPSLKKQISNSSLIKKSNKNYLTVEIDDLQTPRFERRTSIRTFKTPTNNPILNPPIYKIPSRKTFAEKNHSPSNIYLNHSGSNPNMYFSSTNSSMFLSTNKSNKKNVSEMIAQSLIPDTTKSSKRRNQEKKHFSKHRSFIETAGNLIYNY